MAIIPNVYVCKSPEGNSGLLYEFYYNWEPVSSDSALYKFRGVRPDMWGRNFFEILGTELNFDKCVVYFRGDVGEYEQVLADKPAEVDVYFVSQGGAIPDTVPEEVRKVWEQVKDRFVNSRPKDTHVDIAAIIDAMYKDQLKKHGEMSADGIDASRLWVGLQELKAEFARRIKDGEVVSVKFAVVSRRRPSLGNSRYLITINALDVKGNQVEGMPFTLGCLSLEPGLKQHLPKCESICLKFKTAETGGK